jgi:hypothetical protein
MTFHFQAGLRSYLENINRHIASVFDKVYILCCNNLNRMKEITPPPHAVKSDTGLTWLDEERNVVIAIASPHELHSLDQAIENHRIISGLVLGVRRPFLIDMSKVKSMSREAREFYAGPVPTQSLLATAIVTNSNIGKIVANFFIGLTKPSMPTRMFTDYETALEWLEQYKNPQ